MPKSNSKKKKESPRKKSKQKTLLQRKSSSKKNQKLSNSKTIKQKSVLKRKPLSKTPLQEKILPNKKEIFFPKLFLKFTIVFALVFLLGISFAKPFIYYQQTGIIEETSIINDNPEDMSNAYFIFFYILFLTAIILFLAKRFIISWLIVLLDSILVFFSLTLLLSIFIDYLAIPLALIFTFLRRLKENNLLIKNIAAISAISVVGVLIGTSLGIYPLLFLLVALSIYDLIAVFKTKHMITLAKTFQKEKTSFTLTLMTKVKTKLQKVKNLEPKKSFELGTGDLVIPLAFCTSLLKYNFPEKALFCILASYIGLSITIWYAAHYRKPLPALPLQSALMLIVFFLPF